MEPVALVIYREIDEIEQKKNLISGGNTYHRIVQKAFFFQLHFRVLIFDYIVMQFKVHFSLWSKNPVKITLYILRIRCLNLWKLFNSSVPRPT